MTDVLYLEVATGQNPERAMKNGIKHLVEEGHLIPDSFGLIDVAHDDGCPAKEQGLRVRACTCEIIGLIVTPESED